MESEVTYPRITRSNGIHVSTYTRMETLNALADCMMLLCLR